MFVDGDYPRLTGPGYHDSLRPVCAHPHIHDTMRDFLRLCKALSDETRLRILGILLVRECCVCEVMQALGISQTRASRNLSLLFNAGFLRQRRDGRWTLYRIDREDFERKAPGLLAAVAGMLERNEMVVTDRRRLESSIRVGPGCGGMVRSVKSSTRSGRSNSVIRG